MARRQLEGLTLPEAEAIIADIDVLEGNPRLGQLGAKFPEEKRLAALAWLASDQTGPVPPGITKTWAKPEEKPDDAGNYAVALKPEHEAHVVDRTIGGKPIASENFLDRAPSWTPADVD
jgi:hypothetical protein